MKEPIATPEAIPLEALFIASNLCVCGAPLPKGNLSGCGALACSLKLSQMADEPRMGRTSSGAEAHATSLRERPEGC